MNQDPSTGRFLPGNQANPAGRTPVAEGGKPNWTTLIRQQLEEASPNLMSKLIEIAEAGDVRALTVALNKVLPDLKSVNVKSDSASLPTMNIILPEPSGDDAKKQGNDDATGDEKN